MLKRPAGLAMNSKIFLASYDKGITRAARAANGEWTVQHLATEHHVTRLTADPSN